MNSFEKKRLSDRALFRFSLVCAFKARLLRGESVSEAIRGVAQCGHFDPKTGARVEVSQRSLYRWLKKYDEHAVEGLVDIKKSRIAFSQALSESFIEFLKTEKILDPYASVPELIRRGRAKKIITDNQLICRSTVYRSCRRLNLPIARSYAVRTRDMRRFAYPHRMQLTMIDGKHFNVGTSSVKRVAIIFIDDATRMVLHSVVGTSENTRLFLRGLDGVIAKFGLPEIIYFDRGPAFICSDTARVIANLGSKLILGEAGYPQARGKIERFNRTIKEQLLRNLDKRPDIDPDLKSLENRFNHYLCDTYNVSPHESLDQKTPYQCFFSDEKPLKIIDDKIKYLDCFVLRDTRKVSKDNVVSVAKIFYEVPTGHAATHIEIFRYMLEDKVTMYHRGQEIRLKPVNLTLNALSRRAKFDGMTPPEVLPPSAAELFYSRDYDSIVDHSGNFFDKENN